MPDFRWRISGFEWDERNREHVAGHDVQPEEVEEVFRGRLYVRRARRRRYIVLGRAATGRGLFVVVARKKRGAARPITARPMTRRDWRLYERRAR